MDNSVELANVEVNEYCILNKETGEKKFSDRKNDRGFTGLYFRDELTFFAIYPTDIGPTIYYMGREYKISKDLSISLDKKGTCRKFSISEYNILIDYKESPYLGIDVWSEEIDVDIFYMIEQRYKTDEFYRQYTTI